MNQWQQQPGDRPTPDRIRRWNSAGWVVFGLLPPAVAVLDASPARRYWLLGLLTLIALCYTVVLTRPDNPVLRRRTYLVVLALVLGATSYLLDGGAAFYVVSLPQFWLFTRAPRDAITLSGAAAALTVFGGMLGQGWSPLFRTGNVVFTVVAYVAGVGLGLWVHRFVGQSHERQEQLATELAVTQKELAAAYQQQGAAEERERLAREIHDTLAQGFASIVVLAEAARAVTVTDPVRCAEQLTSIEQTARENLAEARVLVGSAPESGVAPGSLATTLRRTLDRFVQDTGLTVTTELPDIDLDQRTRVALLHCTQESLANVRKHSGASTVGVVLTELAGGVELEITDDGCGFVVEESRGFGLDGMRRRLAELDGELAVTSSLGDGTRVLASLPTHSQD
ncbi:putative two-component system sensor kinase [Streptomyces bingchenggensis BCW-1]|uniref:Putative two-component system sensor kinase n=1 Tax=Streptomyces bingchenggensis (strain BCW-1) TaxID=749414 RepID=D7CBC5_STRBB|nr:MULTISPECIES: sensor histidine kinase [Streptomyces]ADI12802.1 putative two-component system sensor kinase [Streptomyces bingchenggensis BCW-1]